MAVERGKSPSDAARGPLRRAKPIQFGMRVVPRLSQTEIAAHGID